MVVAYVYKSRKDGKMQTKAFAHKLCGCLVDETVTYEVSFAGKTPVEGEVFDVEAGTFLNIYDPREL